MCHSLVPAVSEQCSGRRDLDGVRDNHGPRVISPRFIQSVPLSSLLSELSEFFPRAPVVLRELSREHSARPEQASGFLPEKGSHPAPIEQKGYVHNAPPRSPCGSGLVDALGHKYHESSVCSVATESLSL